MKGTDYQKAVQELIKERPSPGRHAAFNALRHISKAWDLRNLDREMAVFRSFCAEEEAATAIFHALRRLRYPGAERLKHRDHVQKAAVMPFLWMVPTLSNPIRGKFDKGSRLVLQTDGGL
jgi:hypothetical protein